MRWVPIYYRDTDPVRIGEVQIEKSNDGTLLLGMVQLDALPLEMLIIITERLKSLDGSAFPKSRVELFVLKKEV